MFYVYDDQNNKVEALSKEGVLALLEQAIEDGDLEFIEEDSAFVSKIKDVTSGGTYHLSFVTQAQYNELVENDNLIANCLYIVTDDTSYNDIVEAINDLMDQTDANTQAIQDNAEAIIDLQKILLFSNDTGDKNFNITLPENIPSEIEVVWSDQYDDPDTLLIARAYLKPRANSSSEIWLYHPTLINSSSFNLTVGILTYAEATRVFKIEGQYNVELLSNQTQEVTNRIAIHKVYAIKENVIQNNE